jgi:hypothetical protein
MITYVGSRAADGNHCGVGGGPGVAGVKALRPCRAAIRAGLDPGSDGDFERWTACAWTAAAATPST